MPQSSQTQTQTHDSAMFVRANGALIEQASARARNRGVSLSELVRTALRRELQEAA